MKTFLLKDLLLVGQKKFCCKKKKKIKNKFPWTYVIYDLNDAEIVESFYEKELQKTDQAKFRTKKVIRRKGDKLFVKRNGYDRSLNNWIYKTDLI